MRLLSSIVPVEALSVDEVNSMYELLVESFDNVKREIFEFDLKDKQLAIILREQKTSRLVGFSTQKFFDHTWDNQPVRIVFSGDTIISKAFWGSLELSLSWGEMMLAFLEKDPEIPLYWMLISKGFRTYRFLPTFFLEYYPCSKNLTPERVITLMNSIGERLFQSHYDSNFRLIRNFSNSYYLKEDLAVIPEFCLEKEEIKFFLEKNPLFSRGDELVCLAQFATDNLKSSYLKKLLSRRERHIYEA